MNVLYRINAIQCEEFSKLIEECMKINGKGPVKLGNTEISFCLGYDMQFVLQASRDFKSWDFKAIESDIKRILTGAGWTLQNGKLKRPQISATP